eukprot:TRINITY_DN4257_c0_g1_i1.p1 TRINITY_DN4257_c0_g1~~TRINITY_DN4257_c0_g1_i1.p1  ORF type:complete len:422 (+),score=122.07 TRINITY_DN4257_c0_g1_i1:90-1355(+)
MSSAAQTKFTCFTCGVGFPSAEAQRLHYKTDWHRYNLKRKVAGMAPVPAEAFRTRVTAQQQEAKRQMEVQTDGFFCAICNKKFNSQNALDTHLQSKKHKLKAAKPQRKRTTSGGNPLIDAAHQQPLKEQQIKYAELQRKIEEEYAQEQKAEVDERSAHTAEIDEIEQKLSTTTVEPSTTTVSNTDTQEEDKTHEEPILELVDSIFDTYRAETFEENLEYMSQQHGLFIPNIEYVSDLEGLVRYLQLKVGNYFTCLSCNKRFTDLEGVRRHMADKGHKHIDYSEDGQLELGDFYDFSSTYPDDEMLTDEQRDEDLTLATLPAPGQAYRDGYELVLPSGRRAGHRSLNRYYKQHFKMEDQRDSVRIGRIAAQYRALGHKSVELPSERVRRDQAYGQRRFKNNHLDVGVKANKLQHHFREQVLQ